MAVQLGPGDLIGAELRIVAHLADGGMGRVYVAEHGPTSQRVALKVMHPQLVNSERARDRFELEARVSSRIQSPHVCAVLAAGIDPQRGIPWIAMELLEGESLEARIRRAGALPVAEVLSVARPVAEALAAAHQAAVVHRDLKPENIFLVGTPGAPAPLVKILDFGIAKWLVESYGVQTATSALGSPIWMAPEQTDDKGKIGIATDVWAFGLVVFYMLVAKPYWRAANRGKPLGALLTEILVEPLSPASARATELGFTAPLPSGFDDWFARCVERDPARRFRDAVAAISALDAVFASRVGPHPTPRGAAIPMTREAEMSAPTAAATPAAKAAPAAVSTPATPIAAAVRTPPHERPATPRTQPRRSGSGCIWAIAAVLLIGLLSIGGITVWVFRATIFGDDDPPPPIVRPIGDDPRPLPPPLPPPIPTIPDAGSPVPPPEPPRVPDAGRHDAGTRAPPPTPNLPTGAPLEAARACARTGDWPCVVRTLEGSARSEPELALLVDGYRRTGNNNGATRIMRRYLMNYPTARHAMEYRRRLEGVAPR